MTQHVEIELQFRLDLPDATQEQAYATSRHLAARLMEAFFAATSKSAEITLRQYVYADHDSEKE